MKANKKWIVLIPVFLGILCLSGVYGYHFKENVRKESLVYLPKTSDGTNDFWTSLISGTKMAAKEYGANLKVYAPETELDIQQQTELLQKAILEKPDAILISPSSFNELDELLQTAVKKGIQVVYVDSYTEAEVQKFTVATDNLEAGRILGRYAAKLLEGDEDAQIAIVGHVKGVSTAIEREQGFREGLGKFADNVVEVAFCDSKFDKAYEIANEFMQKYPNLKMIAGMNEYSSVGAARAIRDAGNKQKIKVVGVDSSKEAVQLLEEGVFNGFVIQKAFKMGYIGVRETLRMLQGEKVDTYIDSGCELVTLENIYTSEIEKMVFPFNNVEKEPEFSEITE